MNATLYSIHIYAPDVSRPW